MSHHSEYMQCKKMSTGSLSTCEVNRVFDNAAPDRVVHVKVNGSFGACTYADELVLQLSRIGKKFICLFTCAECWYRI